MARTVSSIQVKYYTDSVEAISYRDGSLVALGMYQLNDSTQIREGGVEVFLVTGATADGASTDPISRRVASINTKCGVLDMKWVSSRFFGCSDNSDPDSLPLLYLALSSGALGCIRFEQSSADDEMFQAKFESISVGCDVIQLAIDLVSRGEGETSSAVLSDSSGYIYLLPLSSVSHMSSSSSTDSVPVIRGDSQSWKANDFECWALAADGHNCNILYSGGDDCLLKVWDLRCLSTPCHEIQSHESGVTAIRPHPHNEHIFLSGSYDEQLISWDKRALSSCSRRSSGVGRGGRRAHSYQPLGRVKTDGGGVWRIKWHESGELAAVAAMHAGFYVYRFTDSHCMTEVLRYSGRHESLAYGIDWLSFPSTAPPPPPSGHNETVTPEDISSRLMSDPSSHRTSPSSSSITTSSNFASPFYLSSCSFYDSRMDIWTVSGLS